MKVILELDEEEMIRGFVTVTKVTPKGRRRGQMGLDDVCALLNDVFHWNAMERRVRLISSFDKRFIAFGMNGAKWAAVKEIPPDDYYLIAASGNAYHVRLPRLVVLVSNYATPRIFWTKTSRIRPGTRIYPLLIGNVYGNGSVCLGNTGLRCQQPEEIDAYIRKIIEAPSSGHLIEVDTDTFYQALSDRWDASIGHAHGIQLGKLLETVV